MGFDMLGMALDTELDMVAMEVMDMELVLVVMGTEDVMVVMDMGLDMRAMVKDTVTKVKFLFCADFFRYNRFHVFHLFIN